eukprot:77556_1
MSLCRSSMSMEIVEWIAVISGLIVTCYTAITGYQQFKKAEDTIFIFKYMFYICMSLGFIQLVLFLTQLTLCNIHPIPISNSNIISIASFLTYSILISHLFFLWLTRLYYTFLNTTYAKSNTFYRIIISIFICITLCALFGLILFLFDIENIAAILILMGAFGYFFVSTWLLHTFVRQLLKLITCKVVTVRFKTEKTLRHKTDTLDLPFADQILVKCIAKYLVLGIASFTTSLIVIGLVFIQFFIFFGDLYSEILKLCVIIDVVNNIICIYLQFNYSDSTYQKICGWFDSKVNMSVEKKATSELGQNTFSFYSK